MNAPQEKTCAIMTMPLVSTHLEIIHVLASQVTVVMDSTVKVRKQNKVILLNDN